jgi:hypothetical protein
MRNYAIIRRSYSWFVRKGILMFYTKMDRAVYNFIHIIKSAPIKVLIIMPIVSMESWKLEMIS